MAASPETSAPPFVHLGARSDHSLGESIARVEELCWEASRDEQGYLALTDVNSLGRAPAFAAAAGRQGLRPLYGAEIGVLPLGQDVYHGTAYRVRLLVENERGWRNVVRLVNAARANETELRPPHLPLSALCEDARGLVLLIGGERGELTTMLREGNYEGIEKLIAMLGRAFDVEHLYVELPPAEDAALCASAKSVAAFFGVQSVVVPKVRCANAADDAAFRFFAGELDARGGEPTIASLLKPAEQRHHLASRALVAARYTDYPEAIANTTAIAKRCSTFTLPQIDRRFPIHNFGRGVDAESFIWNTAFSRATDRYGDLPTRYKERLNREFREIVDAGLANAVVSLVRLNEELEAESVQRGPGAGLLTNSMIASLLGLTRFDPLKFDLAFELPAGIGKGSFPLLEVSIPANQEAAAVGALQRLFEGQVLPVGMWKGWKVNQCLERAAEVLSRDGRWVSQMAKNAAFLRAREFAGEQPAAYIPPAETALDSPEALGWLVSRLEGRARQLVADEGLYTFSVDPIDQVIPQRRVAVAGGGSPMLPLSEWTSEELGRLRLGRIGFEHTPLLDLIGESTEIVRQQEEPHYSPERTAADDAATYRLLREGATSGIEPLESPAIRRRLRVGQPADLHALIKLLRTAGPDLLEEHLPDFSTILLCHVCAAIRAHHPRAFLAAALSQAAGDVARTAMLLDEATALGIDVAALDVNYSSWRWTSEPQALRPGFIAVRGMTPSAGAEIAGKRREMHFADLADFCRRTDKSRVRAGQVRALVQAGAFDGLAQSRAEALRQYHELFPLLRPGKGQPATSDDLSFFDRDAAWWVREQDPAAQGADIQAALSRHLNELEMESCGLLLRRALSERDVAFLRVSQARSARTLPMKLADQEVTLLGVFASPQLSLEQPGTTVADMAGCLLLARGTVGEALGDEDLAGRPCVVTGRLVREPFLWQLEVQHVQTLEQAMELAARPQSLVLDLSRVTEEKRKPLLALLKQFPGETGVAMEWLPAGAPRLFHRIASRRILVCPLLLLRLEQLLGRAAWSLRPETAAPATSTSTTRLGIAAAGMRALRRLRMAFETRS